MLALARRLNPEVTYIPGDMRTVRLGRDVRCGHCTRRDQLHAHPERPQGAIFLTPVERSPENFLQNRMDCSTHTASDTGVVFIQNEYDPDPSDSTYEVTFLYLIRRDEVLEIVSDRHG